MKLSFWADVAAEVLNEPAVDSARAVLAQALLLEFSASQVARVHVAGGSVQWFLSGAGTMLRVNSLPVAAEVQRHPLNRYRLATADTGPMLLADVVSRGWGFEGDTRLLMEKLGLPLHQLSIPMERGPRYDGWVVVTDDGFASSAVTGFRPLQHLLRGLDRHLTLLAGEVRQTETAGLTPRELVVLGLLARGRTAGAIAARLGISARTVHKHQEHLYRKLGAVDRLSAVLRAQEAGVLASAPRPDSNC